MKKQEKKIKEEYKENKKKWLEENGFDAEGWTYIVIGDSYSIKDELKNAGFRYNAALKRWLKASPANFGDKTIRVNAKEILEFTAWGEGQLLPKAKDKIDWLAFTTLPEGKSEFVGEICKRLPPFLVTFVKHGTYYNSTYGSTNIYTFEDNKENIFVWWSSKRIDREIGEQFYLSGIVKDHKLFHNQKQTLLKNCIIKDKED